MSKEKTFDMASALNMLYLCSCAVSGQQARHDRLSSMDLIRLYAMCQYHSLAALACDALEQAGFAPAEAQRATNAFQQAKEKSVRKNLLLDLERSKLFAFMEQRGIWHMPLKGVILKDLYPRLGLRQMADNDILFDSAYRQIIREWFETQGYTVTAYNVSEEDVYEKPPIFNFEMHAALFNENFHPLWDGYYRNVKPRLLKDEGCEYAYHFSDEDFYIYFFAHCFKHYDNSGTGLRFLMDLYLYLEKKQREMNWTYIDGELHALGLADFERDCRALLCEIFSDVHAFKLEQLSAQQREMLEYFLSCGTYGSLVIRASNGVEAKGRLAYLLERLFPGPKHMQRFHPLFAKHKWLLPIGWIYRIIRPMRPHSKGGLQELKTILKAKRR